MTSSQSSLMNDILSSTVAATTTSLLVTPFDVVTKHQQFHGTTIRGTIQGILAEEGFFGFYRGIRPTIALNFPAAGIFYPVYSITKNRIDSAGYVRASLSPVVAAVSTRALTTMVTLPLEFVRTHAQTRSSQGFAAISYVRSVVQTKGPLALWTGAIPTMLRDCPFSGVYWFVLESSRVELLRSLPNSPFVVNFASGVLGGTAASVATHPFDVVKTVMQGSVVRKQLCCYGEDTGVKTAILCLYKHGGGVGAFFRGVGVRTFKVAPSCGVMISTYELLRSYGLK
eukprot:PhF_6_TR17419/c0_g1_i1/m.26659/K15119/SLC25A39_40; solute carrier family 25, member 39/40